MSSTLSLRVCVSRNGQLAQEMEQEQEEMEQDEEDEEQQEQEQEREREGQPEHEGAAYVVGVRKCEIVVSEEAAAAEEEAAAQDEIEHTDYPGREFLVFWEGYEVADCSYEPTKEFAFDAAEMELVGTCKKIAIGYNGNLRQCKVLEVLSVTSAKACWVRPPAGEPKEFIFDLIEMTESISEWTIRGYDVSC